MIVVDDEVEEKVCSLIIGTARTGEGNFGDGRIFVTPIKKAIQSVQRQKGCRKAGNVMVEIIAIVRPNKTAETKQALLDIGKPGFTCVRVSGRGKQAVVRTFMDGSVITTGLNNKRMFIIEAENDDEQLIVDKLMAVNCTGEHGDGRIFTVDLQSSYSVREGKVMTI